MRRKAGQTGSDRRLDKSAQWPALWLVLLAKYYQDGSSDARDNYGMEENAHTLLVVKERPERRRKFEYPNVHGMLNIKWVLKIGEEAWTWLLSCNCRLLLGRMWLCRALSVLRRQTATHRQQDIDMMLLEKFHCFNWLK